MKLTKMASQLRKTFKPESPPNDLETDNLESIPSWDSVVNSGEDNSNSPSPQLNFSPNDNGSLAKQELQRLWEIFTSWLQPEKRSKEEMISQLVLEQFLNSGHYKDKDALTEKWKSSGENMERFMEGLTDECLKPPVMVHVSMQGQEALFSDHLSLKQVISEFKEQQSATSATGVDGITPLQTPHGRIVATGYEDTQDGYKHSQHTSEVNSGVYSLENERDPLLIIQGYQTPDPEEGDIFCGIPHGAKGTKQRSSRHQDQSLWERFPEAVPMELQAGLSSRLDHTEDNEDGFNAFWNATEVNAGASNTGNEIYPLLTIQTEDPETEERCFSHGDLDEATRGSQGLFRSPGESQSAPSPEDVPVEVLMLHSKPQWPPSQSVSLCQNLKANSTDTDQQERLHRDLKTHNCDQCPQTFKYRSRLLAHQRKHRNERTFFCPSCHKGFYNHSDLRVHQVIHKQKKPFTCSTCRRSFSHKTTLHAHERIHTGEKPYTCSLCNHSFRQSSTYHRHLRNCHK